MCSILIPLASSQHNLYDIIIIIIIIYFPSVDPNGYGNRHRIWKIYLLLCIQYQTPDDGQETCPKHVEFYSKNKFESLVHFVLSSWDRALLMHSSKTNKMQRYTMVLITINAPRFRQFLCPSSGAQNCIHNSGQLSSFFCILPLL